MAFIAKKGGFKRVEAPVTPSTAFAANSLVTFSSGKLIPATSSTAAADIYGVITRAIASTDSDYASDRLVSVVVPVEKNCVFEADVTSGLVATDVGLYVDLTDASTINRGASSVDAAYCVGVISSTKGLFIVRFGGSN